MNPLTALKAAFRRLAEPSKPDIIIHRTIGSDDDEALLEIRRQMPAAPLCTHGVPMDQSCRACQCSLRFMLHSEPRNPRRA